MELLLGGIGALLTAMFGTQQYQRWNDRKNGNGGPELVARAIRDEGAKTRRVLHEHNERTSAAMGQFRSILADMNKDCSVAHATLAEQIRKDR